MSIRLFVVIALLVLCFDGIHAQDSTWKILGELSVDRHRHKAAYIGNSQILVVGGYTKVSGNMIGERTASCEIIDVARKTIRPAASTAVSRGDVTLVTSPLGEVYVLGGDTDDGPSNIVEHYNVEKDAWETVGYLVVPRWQHVATFISDTEILVIAGWDEQSTEIFNVETGRSERVLDYPERANGLALVNLPGHVPAVVGGRTRGPNTAHGPEVKAYDRNWNLWINASAVPEYAVRPSSMRLRDGRVILTGGVKSERPFVTRTNVNVVGPKYAVSEIADLAIGRQWHGITQMSTGDVLVAGGFTDNEVITATTEWIDVEQNTVRPGPTMNAPRTYIEIIWFSDAGGEYAVVVSGLSTTGSGTRLVEYIGGPCPQSVMPLTNSGIVTTGNARLTDSAVVLTQAESYSRGAVWSTSKVDLRQSFSMLMGFRMLQGDDMGEVEPVPSAPGADGVAIVIQNEGLDALGQPGRGIGYDGITSSLAIEFDAFQNEFANDPNGNHIGVQSMGVAANTARHAPPANLAFASNIPQMRADGRIYYAYLEYQDRRLRVYFNDRPSFRAPAIVRDIAIDSLLALDDGRAWIGVTSATGKSIQQHELVMWEMNGCRGDALVSVDDRSPDRMPIGVPIRLVGSRVHLGEGMNGIVEVFDLQGRLQWSTVTSDAQIDLSNGIRRSGCYIVRIRTEGTMLSLPWMLVN